MNLSSSIWFFFIVFTSLTGSLAYGLWKLMERFLKKRRKYNWIIFSSKLVILFWTVPFLFLFALDHAYAGNGNWYGDFAVTPVLRQILTVLFVIWAVGFFLQVVLYAGARVQRRRLYRYNLVPADEERRILADLREEYGVRIEVSVCENIYCRIPKVSGVLCPVILLPPGFCEEERLPAIIGHELMHVKHRDLFWKYLLSWLLRIHWFNPVFGFLFHDIVEWSEFYCDRDMCRKEDASIEFAAYFTAILESAGNGNRKKDLLSLSLYENAKSIEKRILMMRQYHYEKDWKKQTVVLWMAVFAAAALAVSYGTGRGLMSGYGLLRASTERITTERPQEPEMLTEERISAEGISEKGASEAREHVTRIEMSGEEVKSKEAWKIPAGTLKYTPRFPCEAGDEIIVTAQVFPGAAEARVGIIEPDGSKRVVSSSKVLVHTFQAEGNGQYRVYVENQSEEEFEVELIYRNYRKGTE